MSKFITWIVVFVALCTARRPEITFYTECDSGYKGDSITFQSKRPNSIIEEAPRLFPLHKCHCVSGFWGLYGDVNYTFGTAFNIWSGKWGTEKCFNQSLLTHTGSARYLGPEDMKIESISFYPEKYYVGSEIIITGPASVNIPFKPQSLFTTGRSNWTFFTGSDFDGKSTCFISTQEMHALYTLMNSNLSNVQSILRGCNSDIDTYYFAQKPEPPYSPEWNITDENGHIFLDMWSNYCPSFSPFKETTQTRPLESVELIQCLSNNTRSK